MKRLLIVTAMLVVAACDRPAEPTTAEPATETPIATDAPDGRLAAVLDAQPDDVKARYQYRHPAETLEFFGIEPGMTVVEGLPGGGWYTKILLPYLGAEGHVIGADYSLEMFPLFPFGTPEFLAQRATWTTDFPAGAEVWAGEDGARVSAFHFGSMPAEFAGTADAVLMIRAFHNLARFEGEGGFLTEALADIHAVLKPGGILGVVQHRAQPDMPDDWANGNAGYLKQSFLVERLEAAGFEFVAASEINANERDRPTTADAVWRLPPSYREAGDDAAKRAAVDAIGESDRMTLLFRKPQ